MKVKGEALLSLPIFLLKKYDKSRYSKWMLALSDEARTVFSSPINKNQWYPIKETLSDPTRVICDLYFNGSTKGAFECGRFSAEYGLKGIYKILVKMSSPKILIKKASQILPGYYKGSEMEVFETGKCNAILRVSSFPDMDEIIEQRIAGWIHRATEISGGKRVNATVISSITKNSPCTEYDVSWKIKLFD